VSLDEHARVGNADAARADEAKRLALEQLA